LILAVNFAGWFFIGKLKLDSWIDHANPEYFVVVTLNFEREKLEQKQWMW
jgi:hypothetical protein